MANLGASGTVPRWVGFLHICTKEPHSHVVALPGGDCWKAQPISDLLGREKTVGMFEVFGVKLPRNSQLDPEGDWN